jgi:hypothetical protein
MPEFILEVERDEDIQDSISEAVCAFLRKFDEGKKRLIELNGGPPRRLQTKPKPTPQPRPEYVDIIP